MSTDGKKAAAGVVHGRPTRTCRFPAAGFDVDRRVEPKNYRIAGDGGAVSPSHTNFGSRRSGLGNDLVRCQRGCTCATDDAD